MNTGQVIHELGSPSAKQWEDGPMAEPGTGEERLRHTVVGVNFAGTYDHGGNSHPWPVPAPPVAVGFGGVGIVEGVGDAILDANINYEFPLKDAVAAHKAIESGTTSGATVLIP